MEMETPGFGDRSNKPYALKNKDMDLIINLAGLVLAISRDVDNIKSWQRINTILNFVIIALLGSYYYQLFLAK